MGTDKTSLGDRMKGYENISRLYLTRRMPTIIRIDGKAFHTFTRGFKKPFDFVLMDSMKATMLKLCREIQGVKIAYTQSDEISLFLSDYEQLNTDPWFMKNIQKMVSVSASIATQEFNRAFKEISEKYVNSLLNKENITSKEDLKLANTYESRVNCALFDSRVFVIPREEVANYFIWRQQDATRNSIEMVGHANFSQQRLHKVSCNQIQDLLMTEKGINWNNFSTTCKRGCCAVKTTETVMMKNHKTGEDVEVTRSDWVIDSEIPIFTQDRDYIEKYV